MRYHYLIIVILAATCGALLNRAGAWIVHHDHINYSLPKVISNAAEIANVLGPLLWIAGVILAAPLALGLVRNVTSFWKLVAIEALAYLSLLCSMGSGSTLGLIGFGATAVLLRAVAVVWARFVLPRLAHQRPLMVDSFPKVPTSMFPESLFFTS